MFYYTPRIWHAAGMLLLCVLMIALCGLRGARGWVLVALLFGAFMFALMSAAVLWMLMLQAYDSRLEKMIELAKMYTNMDDEARQAFAFQFPSMQYRMKRGQVRAFFEDTNVPIEMFKLFLQTSDKKYVSARRNWYGTDRPEWAWIAIMEWLKERDLIFPDSAAGSHSWMWKGNSWNYLQAYWSAGIKLVNMQGENIMHNPGYTPPVEEGASD
jgi:hypothetical protein